MTLSKALADRLQMLGLTANESRAYLAVAKLGLCKVAQVGRETGLHRTEIYHIMPRLIAIGLMEQTLDRPKRYQTSSIRNAITALKESAVKRYADLAQNTDDLIAQLEKLRSRLARQDEEQIRVTVGIQNIQRNFTQMLASAEHEVLLMMRPAYPLRWRSYVRHMLKEISSKNLKARAILEVNKDNTSFAKWLASVCEVRHHEPLHVPLYMVDSRSASIGLTPYTQTDPEHISQLFTNYPAYVKLIRDFFDAIWKQAVPLDARLEMLRGRGLEAASTIRVLWGRTAVYTTFVDWHLKATKRMTGISTTNGPIRMLRRFEKPMSEAHERNVRWRLICRLCPENFAAVQKLRRIADVRHMDRPFGLGIAVLDDSEAIIHYIDPDSAELADSPADIALHITDRSVAHNLLRMLDSMWKHAQPIETAMRKLAPVSKGKV